MRVVAENYEQTHTHTHGTTTVTLAAHARQGLIMIPLQVTVWNIVMQVGSKIHILKSYLNWGKPYQAPHSHANVFTLYVIFCLTTTSNLMVYAHVFHFIRSWSCIQRRKHCWEVTVCGIKYLLSRKRKRQ